MANEFKVEIGEEAEIIGGFQGIVVARGMLQSLTDDELRPVYHIRNSDKTLVAWEAELVFFSE
jgi:hypothetical protein